MMRQTIHIEAPVETVFDHFMDPTSDLDLMPVETEVLESKRTDEGTGTYTRYRSKLAGVPFEMFDVYAEVVPNKLITSRSSSASVGTWRYLFEPEGSGTKVTMEHESRSFWRLPLLRGFADAVSSRANASYMPKAKARIEAELKAKAVPGQRKPAGEKARKQATSG